MPDPQTSIVAHRLSKRFGRQMAIRDISFEVARGEIVGFLGPNGAGKSTTLRILTGVLPATSGYLSVCGLAAPWHAAEIRRRIGYMPENNPLPEDMRVIEYLRFRARLKGIPWRQRRARIEHAMEVCELHRKARRKIIGTLSKGFRQRVGIADAILAAPAVTILDEPTIGLDPHQVIAIRQLLDSLRGETTVIFSSHILSEVEVSCDRVLILNQGYLVAQGTADELRDEFLPGARFRIEAAGPAEHILAELRGLGEAWECTLDPVARDGFHHVDLRKSGNGASGEQILRQLMASGRLVVRSFHPVRPSLEEIFLTATRHSWRDDVSANNPAVSESP
jgi:ABC-2 type transport system ATP-binding protein